MLLLTLRTGLDPGWLRHVLRDLGEVRRERHSVHWPDRAESVRRRIGRPPEAARPQSLQTRLPRHHHLRERQGGWSLGGFSIIFFKLLKLELRVKLKVISLTNIPLRSLLMSSHHVLQGALRGHPGRPHQELPGHRRGDGRHRGHQEGPRAEELPSDQ